MNILKTKPQSLQEKIANAPTQPGCYMYLDEKGGIIYVGKAKIIANRVKSYFINYSRLDSKIQVMVENIADVNFLTVDSEVEALILESNLIKKYRPKYNTVLRDDKNYIMVKFEKQVKGVNDFPRIRIVRTKEHDDAEYFGPYPSTLPIKNIMKRIRKVFPYASCDRKLIQISKDPLKVETNNSVPCLYYHLGLCKAPCASLQSREDYMKDFNAIKKFFRGEKTEIMKDLEKNMNLYSKNFEYERAAQVRDKINDIKYVTRSISIDSSVDDIIVTKLKKEERENGIKQLVEELRFPGDKLRYHEGFKIECYDISNIQGTSAVGAMTVMVDGEVRKDLYRKFKIKRENTPNDFAMLQEVLTRRFSHALEDPNEGNKPDPSFSVLPDLVIIDGGKGQLAATYKILRQLNIHNELPIVGLAKREEEIFKYTYQFIDSENQDPNTKTFTRIYLPRGSEALYLVQRIRDEAHRFGITYHRKLRSKKMVLETKKSKKSG